MAICITCSAWPSACLTPQSASRTACPHTVPHAVHHTVPHALPHTVPHAVLQPPRERFPRPRLAVPHAVHTQCTNYSTCVLCALQVDLSDALPLHYALRHKADLAVIRQLLDAHPESIEEDGWPALAPPQEPPPKQPVDPKAAKKGGASGSPPGSKASPPGKASSPPSKAASPPATATMYSANRRASQEAAEAQAAPKRSSPMLHTALITGSNDAVVEFVRQRATAAREQAQARDHAEQLENKTSGAAAAAGLATSSAVAEATNAVLLTRDEPAGRMPLHVALACGRTAKLVLSLLSYENGAAREADAAGNLPLHLALANKASEAIVMAVFTAHKDAAWQADGNGKLPLAVGMEHGVPRSVTWALITANPDAANARDDDGRLCASAGVDAAGFRFSKPPPSARRVKEAAEEAATQRLAALNPTREALKVRYGL